MGLYEVYVFVGFGMEAMLANFHMCCVMFLLRTVLNMRVHEDLCFMYLIFSLSRPYELLLLLCFMSSWT